MAGTLHSSPSALVGYTFTASGECYELNNDGTITGPFAANVPAITDAGFKARQSLTNLATYSQQFDNAIWTKEQVTVTANATTAPDGTVTADEVICTATTNQYRIYQALGAGTNALTQGFFVKRNGADFVALSDGTAAAGYVVFDLLNGVVTTESGADGYITDCGNGWYFCVAVDQATGWDYTLLNIGDTAANAVPGTSWMATTAHKIYLWQSQTFAGSLPDGGPLIITTTAAATRGAAALTHNIFADASALADGDMLLWANVDLTGTTDTGTKRIAHWHDGSSSNIVYLFKDGANLWAATRAGAVDVYVANVAGSGNVSLLIRRSGGNWRGGFIKNGVLTWMGADTAGVFPTGMVKHDVGHLLGGAQAEATIDSTFIKPGTFDTDQKVIDAITGAP